MAGLKFISVGLLRKHSCDELNKLPPFWPESPSEPEINNEFFSQTAIKTAHILFFMVPSILPGWFRG